VYNAGFAGAYWSADAANGTTARSLGFTPFEIYNLNGPSPRSRGFAVRCIKQNINGKIASLPDGIIINNATAEGTVASIFDDTPYSPPIDIQGVVDNRANVVNVKMSYIAAGSATTLPAYSRTFTIDAADTQDGVADIVAKFSWRKQKNLVIGRIGTFNATITTDRTYKAKKLDIDYDTARIIAAKFGYPTDDSGSIGTATLKVIAGIPDRMFGKEDNNGDTDTHSFLYLPVTNPITGRTWLNNNLGAAYADTLSAHFNPAQQATASSDYKAYGSLFQWGRKPDGHELINWTDEPAGNGKFGTVEGSNDEPNDTNFRIYIYYKFYNIKMDKAHEKDYNRIDWRRNINDTLWASESSPNNGCPVGYRLPTTGSDGTNKEWAVEVKSWNKDGDTTSEHALASTLRLPMSGYRHRDDGSIVEMGTTGYYWSATANISTTTGLHYVFALLFNNREVSTDNSNRRRWGFNVRCIKDE
jgi:uncharacterized protein (TIGR02145 family)